MRLIHDNVDKSSAAMSVILIQFDALREGMFGRIVSCGGDQALDLRLYNAEIEFSCFVLMCECNEKI